MTAADSAPRRERILSAAASEFARHGFAGARVDRIAAAAGVNKQLLFHYFGSKGGLHRAALKSLLERPAPPAQASKAPVERLRDLASQLATTAESHPALLALLASPPNDQDAVAVADEWLARAKRQARQILQDGQRAGYVRDDAEIDAISEVVVGAMLGWSAAGDPMTAGRTETYRETLLKMTMDYCAWR
ncbi:MAG: TetR/AcrR family transcriptional regulator [Gemmatimonadales bacterium]|jgi:TetR/AcrR family transcriptional regulator